ncbi:MAG: VWA domain-containing protein [Spirochaetales bacterium]|nr:VWA domain-containing protein [Spirochaetales bacterium]
MAQKKPGAVFGAIIAIFIAFIIIVVTVSECEDDYSTQNADQQFGTMKPEEAKTRLKDMSRTINPITSYVQSVETLAEIKTPNLADTLPDPSLITKHYPLTVNPRDVSSADVVIEVFCSTEKSGENQPDNWFTTVARDFNNNNVRTAEGKRIRVRVRYIDSGTGYLYISSGKYIPDAFSPSNLLWIKMTQASGVPVTMYTESLVGNTAGIVMKDATYDLLKKNFGEVTLQAVIDAVAQGDIAMGYTDPYASSTGLNFLISILSAYAKGNESKMLSDEVVSAFEVFQRGVPYVAFTTIQMRDSVTKGGLLDAFVMEHQTYLRAEVLQNGYKFIPFGIRHDNPLYGVGELSAEKRDALAQLAKYAESRRNLANEFKFNQNAGYESSYVIPSGETLIAAQALWKQKKNVGKKIAAVFVSDVSGSMGGYSIQNLKIALREGAQFIDPKNAIGLVEYSTEVHLKLPIQPFNALQQSRYLAAVKSMTTGGDTAMFDGIIAAMDLLVEYTTENPDFRPVLFVLTDGQTNAGSFQALQDIGAIANTLDIPIYTIAYGEDTNTSLLQQISSINEAASMSANDEAIVNKIGALLNLEM